MVSELGSTITNGFNRSTESSNGLGRRKFTRTRFRQHVELMFSGPLVAKKEEEKCSYLLIWCGEKGRDIANTWIDVTEDDNKKLKTYFERSANHVEPKCNFPSTSFTKEYKQKQKRQNSS